MLKSPTIINLSISPTVLYVVAFNVLKLWLVFFEVTFLTHLCLKISPGCSLEGLMLKLKLQYFGYIM